MVAMLGLMRMVSMLDSFMALIAWAPASGGTLGQSTCSEQCERKEGRRTRVVELSSLTDGKSSGTDNHDLLDIGPLELGEDSLGEPASEVGSLGGSVLGLQVLELGRDVDEVLDFLDLGATGEVLDEGAAGGGGEGAEGGGAGEGRDGGGSAELSEGAKHGEMKKVGEVKGEVWGGVDLESESLVDGGV